jgi:hypothetical protein
MRMSLIKLLGFACRHLQVLGELGERVEMPVVLNCGILTHQVHAPDTSTKEVRQ